MSLSLAVIMFLLLPCASAQLSGCYLGAGSTFSGAATSTSITFSPNRLSYTLQMQGCVCIADVPIVSHGSTGTNQGTYTLGASSVSPHTTCGYCSNSLPTAISYSLSNNLVRVSDQDCLCKTTWSAPSAGNSCVNQVGCASPVCDADVSGPWCPTMGTCNHGFGTLADGQGYGYCSTTTNYVGPPSYFYSSVASSTYPKGACPITDSGDSNAVIIGVAVAVILLLLVGGFVAYFCYVRNDAMTKSADAISAAPIPASAMAPNAVTTV